MRSVPRRFWTKFLHSMNNSPTVETAREYSPQLGFANSEDCPSQISLTISLGKGL